MGPNITKATEQARFALRGPRHRARVAGHPDIVAQLTFGTWRFLLPDRDPGRQRLWADSVHAAFPLLPGDPNLDEWFTLRQRVTKLLRQRPL